MAVVTLNIHHRGVRGNELPAVFKKVVLDYLSKCVFLKFDSSIQKAAEELKREEERVQRATVSHIAGVYGGQGSFVPQCAFYALLHF